MKAHKTIAIIPARGDSKRLPQKNIRMLDGVPLLVHSILYAQQHKNSIDTICVTTDDADIIKIVEPYGVTVIKRPKALSGDTATTVSALKHVLESLDETYDTVVLLQPTNPLRPKSMLENAFQLFKDGGFDSLMSVSRTHQKFGKIIEGRFVPFNYKMGQRSQDLEPLYYENGLLYISKANLIMNDALLGENNVPFIVDHPFAEVDIDTEGDFEYANYLLNKYRL